MFFKTNNLFYFIMLILRTMFVVSSSRWFNSWIALEINLISIIPILMINQKTNVTSATIKYFLVQVIASIIIILIVIIFINKSLNLSINLNNEIILIAMAIKSGIPPFHFWLPQVIERNEIVQSIIILSWQKIAPFMLLSYCVCEFLSLLIVMSSIIGGLGGLNQKSIKKILTYSSIIHGSWLIFSMFNKQIIWLMYFLIYNISLVIICLIILNFSFVKIEDIIGLRNFNLVKTIFLVNILSIGGLPPFIGFFAKLIVIINMIISTKLIIILIIIIMISLTSLYYYIKISYTRFMIFEKKMNQKISYNKNSILLTIILSINVITPILVYLI